MSAYGGFICAFKERELAKKIEDLTETKGNFTYTISLPDWNTDKREICFISFDP